MKRTIAAISIVIIFVILTPFTYADMNSPDDLRKASIILPFFLEEIEEEAFEGISAKTIVLPEGLHSVGNSAFANSYSLTDVYIPSSVEKIGKNAFTLSKKLTIHGVIGSLAEKWAREHQIPFVASDIWNTINDSINTDDTNRSPTDSFHQVVRAEKTNKLHDRSADKGKSLRPQERPELNPIDYRFP